MKNKLKLCRSEFKLVIFPLTLNSEPEQITNKDLKELNKILNRNEKS